MAFNWFTRLKNSCRSGLRAGRVPGLLGKVLSQLVPARPVQRVRIVAATRMDEKTFWKTSALGRSGSTWRGDSRLVFDIAYDNRLGLPKVYNAALDRAGPEDAVLFVHDDVWLHDSRWLDKLLLALQRYDVVGLAGNRRRVRRQHAWLFLEVSAELAKLDGPNLSGAVAHGPDPQHASTSVFGPAPAHCELLDGLFIAVRNDVARPSGVRFDERFDFHFYDMDFCRTARAAGLSMGTWPIEVVHQSAGSFKGDAWRQGLAVYQAKWPT